MLTTAITDAQMAEMKKIGRLSVNSITCESVSEAHKRWEEIVASVMNACLEQDPESKAYSEPITKHNIVIPHIRIETQAKINFREVVEDSKHRRGLKRCASTDIDATDTDEE